MKKMVAIITVTMILSSILLSVSCSKKEEVIKIGAILPLTGEAGKYGQDAKMGMELALELINKNSNDQKVKIVYEDDQSDAKKSVSSYKKLTSYDNVGMIIGTMTSSSALAVSPLAEKDKVILLSPSASTPLLTDAGDYIFRNELSDDFGGLIQAEMTIDSLNIFNVGILHINNDYGVGIMRSFEKTFKSLKGKITEIESYTTGENNFKPQLSKLVLSKPEAIFLIAQKEYPQIIKQLKEINSDIQIIATPVFEDNEIIKELGSVANNIIYTYYGDFNKDKNEIIIEFEKAFANKFHKEPGYYSALSFDAVNILYEAVRRNRNNNIDEIKNKLYDISNYHGVTGTTTFDKNGDVRKAVTLKTVSNGEFIKWKKK